MRCREESLNVWLVLYIYGWIINLRFAIQMSTSTTKENLLKYSCLLEEACWTSNLHSFRSFFFLFLNCICFWYIKYVCCWTVFTNFGSLLFFNIKHYCAWLPSKPQGTTLAVYSQMLLQVQCFFLFLFFCLLWFVWVSRGSIRLLNNKEPHWCWGKNDSLCALFLHGHDVPFPAALPSATI